MTPPRSVVAALHLADPGGPSRSLQPVLERLAVDGDVVIAVPRLGRAADELSHVGRAVALGHGPLIFPRRPRDLAALPARLRTDARRFRALLRRERAELAIVATTTLPALTLAAWLEGVPTVVYAAELYRQGTVGDALRSAIGTADVRLNERLATVMVACSHAVATQLRHPDRAVVVYPAIDPAVADGDGDAFRRRHALPAGGPVLATLGNLARGRGQDVAVRALAALRGRHPGARLVIAGLPHPRAADLAYAEELRALARELGVGDAVHLVGFERPADVFAVADVVVNPARFAETFGIVAAEALVAGRPVVSTDVGAVSEVLEDGRHALLVGSDRPEAMAASCARLLGDPSLAGRLVDAGRRHVLATYNAERQLPRFEEAIERALIEGGGRRTG